MASATSKVMPANTANKKMEYTTIKTSPGKMYSAISPSSCTIKTEDGDLVQYIEANKQQYFIAPDAKLVSDNNELLLTECTS